MRAAPQPLTWDIDWKHLSDWQKMFLDFPFFGTAARTRRRLLNQMMKRQLVDMVAWDSYPTEVRRAAFEVSEALREQIGWPNAYFLPGDPAGIPFWCFSCGLREVEAFIAVEKVLGAELPENLSEFLEHITFAELIQRMIARKAGPE